MSNSPNARSQRSRRTILAAAEPLFLARGFVGTSMDEIADSAGVSKQTVYTHFGSKEALFTVLVVSMTGDASQQVGSVTQMSSVQRPVEDFLLDFARQELTVVMTPRLMQLRRLVIAETIRFPDLGRTLYENGPARSIEWLASAFEQYASRGELHVPDAGAAASYFNWIIMGAPTNQAMLLGDAGIPAESQLRQHAAESVRIFLAAFRPGDAARTRRPV